MRTLPIVTVLAAGLLASCSKSPIDTTVNAANAVAAKLMAPLVQKDASHQVEGLIRTLDNRPECQLYIDRLREAGRGSPYEGGTELVVVHTYDAAGKAGCVKPN
jgi:hypothetical protein